MNAINPNTSPESGSFTESLTQLERILEQLRKGTLPLEDALTLFESGVQHIGVCQSHLTQAKGKVEVLLKTLNASEELATEPFDAGE